jgi:hypothetical protein
MEDAEINKMNLKALKSKLRVLKKKYSIEKLESNEKFASLMKQIKNLENKKA